MATASPSRLLDPPAISAVTGRHILVYGDESLPSEAENLLQPADFTLVKAESIEAAAIALRGDAPVDVFLADCTIAPAALASVIGCVHRRERKAGGGAQLELVGGDLPVVLVLVNSDQVERAAEAVRSGVVYDYIVRPFSPHQLQAALKKAVEYRRLKLQNHHFRYHLEQLISARTQILQQAMQHLEQSYDITLEALGDALDMKDAETEGHSKRVTAYTLALGRALGLNESHLRIVGRGAFLHDIGKMAIPDAILRKPGKLTAQERDVMRTHSELGYLMIRKIPYLRDAAEIVYAHQECYDGSGYPRGLRGEQIPIGARIFALAETLDAITSNRPYRKAATIAQARKEVLRCAGTQFDPAIVDVFVATPDSIWLNLREGIMRDGPEFSPFGYTFGEVK